MDILNKTIKSLSHEEIVNYKLYTYRKEKDEERKDVLLFDLIRKSTNNDANSIRFFNSLYQKDTNKNTFHRLKSRLLHEVDNSMVQFYFHKTDSHYIYNELSLYKTYVQKNKWDIALYHLKKAEHKAIDCYDYALLDVIYHEFIDFSSQFGSITPSVYIKKRNENRTYLNDLRALDDALATIVFELKQHQTFSKTTTQKLDTLNKAINVLNKKEVFNTRVGFKNKMYQAISSLLISQKDFSTLESYCIKTYQNFDKYHLFTESNHRTKLNMLVHICNACYQTKKYKQSLNWLKKLKTAITEFNNLYYDNYVFYYYNSLANNYSILDLKQAIEVLNEAKNNKAILQQEQLLGYIYLNLSGTYFDLKEHKTALKNILTLINKPSFHLLDNAFKLKINIHELILRIELSDFDYATKLIKQLQKLYRKLLKAPEYEEDADFLMLLSKTITPINWKVTPKAISLTKLFLQNKYTTSSTSIVNYKEWLSAILTTARTKQ